MITFKEYLAESQHKQEIELAEAIKLINTHCKASKNQPLFRGMNGGQDAYILHGDASTRKSANTSNHYTVILDHFLPELGYPKRSKSIILSNNYSTARGFGDVYCILPYDDVKIGVCATSDLWFSPRFKIGNYHSEFRIEQWNQVYRDNGIDALSYEDFVSSIKEKLETGTADDRLKEMFPDPDNIEETLKQAYNPETLELKLETPASMGKYEEDDARELWIGGKCIAIKKDVWYRMQKDEHDDEPAPEDD